MTVRITRLPMANMVSSAALSIMLRSACNRARLFTPTSPGRSTLIRIISFIRIFPIFAGKGMQRLTTRKSGDRRCLLCL